MADYPKLEEMGILHPQEIDRFVVNSISNYDVLQIVYARRKGSLLPMTRSYRFPRAQKSATKGSGAQQSESVMETNPDLRLAIDELQGLVEAKGHKQDATRTIIEELESLQGEVAIRSQRIKDLLRDE